MESQFINHQLETPSTYAEGDFLQEARVLPTIPENVVPSTPRYELIDRKDVNQIILGGIIAPRVYSGDSDPTEWVKYYEMVCDANLWDNDVKFKRLISCLDGPPRLWFINQRNKNPNFGWAEFKAGVITNYTNQCDALLTLAKIQKRVQLPRENYNSYWENKVNLIETYAPKMELKDKLDHLFNGLDETLQAKVINKYVNNYPNSIDEMYTLVKQAADALNFVTPKGNSNQRRVRFESSSGTDDLNEGVVNTNPRRFNNNAPQRRDESQNNRPQKDYRFERLVRSVDSLTQQLYRQQRNPGPSQQTGNNNRTFNPNYQRQNYQQRGYGNNYQAGVQSNSRPEVDNRNKGNNLESPVIGNNTGQDRPQRRTAPDLSTIQCYKCKNWGHYSNRCPEIVRPQVSKNESRQN
jgi:hypothetical protein